MSARILHNQRQACEVLGVSEHVFVHTVRPALKRVPIAGTVRYPQSELERWINNNMEAL